MLLCALSLFRGETQIDFIHFSADCFLRLLRFFASFVALLRNDASFKFSERLTNKFADEPKIETRKSRFRKVTKFASEKKKQTLLSRLACAKNAYLQEYLPRTYLRRVPAASNKRIEGGLNALELRRLLRAERKSKTSIANVSRFARRLQSYAIGESCEM